MPGAGHVPMIERADEFTRVVLAFLGIDESALLDGVQAEGERLWHAIPEWHWSGKTLDDVVPPSYPIKEA